MLWDTMYIFQTCVRCLIKMCGFLGIYSNALACWPVEINKSREKLQNPADLIHCTHIHTHSIQHHSLRPSIVQSISLPITTKCFASGHTCWHWSIWSCSQVDAHSIPLDFAISKPPKIYVGGGEERIRGTGESAACWNERHVRIGMAEL